MRTSFKQLRFPSLGLGEHLSYRDATIPDERNAFATPCAKNVRGTCTFGDRARGGSRPGLRRLEGTVEVVGGGKWLWPNGEAIEWPGGGAITYTTVTQEIIAPDGSVIIDPHEPFAVHCSKGAVPPTPSLCAMYRDRVFLAYGASWFCSRIGEHGDFDYGGDGEDPARALSGNCALAGRKGERVTAFMPVDDRVMFVATERSLWMFDGDPSGGLKRISEFTGCIGQNAWCSSPQGVIFVALDGVYTISDGGARLLSGRLPSSIAGLSDALLAYDPEANGVHVFGEKDGEACDWFIDLGEISFWPVEIPASMRPTAICRILQDGVERAALNGADGVWRTFHAEQQTDDGETLESSVVIGPFRVSARDDLDGIVDEVHATLGYGSGSVVVSVFTSDSAEGAVDAARSAGDSAEHTVSSRRNKVFRPRRRGAWCCLHLSSSSRWAYEGITVSLKLLGRLR